MSLSALYELYKNYFSILKSKLRKLEGVKYNDLKENIKNVLKIIPKETYEYPLSRIKHTEKTYIKTCISFFSVLYT